MTEPYDQAEPADADGVPSPSVGEGTDVTAEGRDLESADTPATSDPDEMTDDGSMGGVGGPGGAG